ncbi:hypothetical protein CCH79_00019996, partial [Gambusia affinis]
GQGSPQIDSGASTPALFVSFRDGCRFLRSKPDLLAALFALTSDPSVAIVKDCYHILINLSADETLHQVLVCEVQVLPVLLKNLQDPEFLFSDQICTILSNLSRHDKTCRTVFQVRQASFPLVLQEGLGLAQLVEIFCNESFNRKAKLHYLGPLLSNLAQLPEARSLLMDQDRCVIQRLLPFTQYEASVVRRGGVIGTLRNCCFDHAHHAWLLSDAVDVLPSACGPAVSAGGQTARSGPRHQEDAAGNPATGTTHTHTHTHTHTAEGSFRLPDGRLHPQLTATKAGRLTLRQKNVYPIVRELHRWEKDVHVGAACEKLVQVLIGDEPQHGMENLMEVDIPQDVEDKLRDADAKEQQELQEEERRRREEEKQEK